MGHRVWLKLGSAESWEDEKSTNLSGFAAMFSTFKWGTLRDNSIFLAYSHLIAIKKGTYLRFRPSGALSQHSINRRLMRVENPDQDLLLATQFSDDISFSPGFGITYDSESFIFEAVFPRLYDGQRESLFYTGMAYAAYKFKMESSKLVLMPSLLFHYLNNAPHQVRHWYGRRICSTMLGSTHVRKLPGIFLPVWG
jgi:hypothetical protein